MILVDTSIWIEHFRATNVRLVELLQGPDVVTHPFVIGEIACGQPPRRETTLKELNLLPSAVTARHEEVLHLLETRKFGGTGLSWVDMHLLASGLLSDARIWTMDRALERAASALGIAFAP